MYSGEYADHTLLMHIDMFPKFTASAEIYGLRILYIFSTGSKFWNTVSICFVCMIEYALQLQSFIQFQNFH